MNKNIIRVLSTAALLSTVYAQAASADTYQVQKGDSLSQIALKYHTSVSNLKAWNSLTSDLIYMNQPLKVSAKTEAAPAPSASIPTAKQAAYTVVKGDALITIANRFHVTVGELQIWNNLNNTIIYVGQVLKIAAPAAPAPQAKAQSVATPAAQTEYTVKPGDCLSIIALKFDMTVAELKTLNLMRSDKIYVGQTLKVSAATSTSIAPAPTSAAPAPAPKAPALAPKAPAPAPAPKPAAAPAKASVYTVVSGDYLGKIASQFGMSVEQLKSLNNLTSDMIYVGQQLKVSGTAASAPASKPVSAVSTQANTFDEGSFVAIAKSMMGVPYVWGGSTASGVDCSGLIYVVANKAGYHIGRYSADGYFNRSYYVSTPKPGDLVFFSNTYMPGISHIGIYIGNNQFINADEKYGVKISSLDNVYYKAHFDSFKRFY